MLKIWIDNKTFLKKYLEWKKFAIVAHKKTFVGFVPDLK